MIEIDENVSLEYISSGLFSTTRMWTHPRRNIDSYEIIYVISGEVYIEEEGIEYSLSRGETLLLAPGVLHRGSRESSGSTKFFWLHFKTDNIAYFNIPKKFNTESDYATLNLFREHLHIVNTENVPHYAKTCSCGSVLSHIASLAAPSEEDKLSAYSKISEWVKQNVRNDMKAGDIAEKFGYSSAYISRPFRKYAGVSLKEYINSERIKLAKELLLSTEQSIKSISSELGFRNENLFVKFFKYHEKMSPTKFRNMYFNIHINDR